MTIDESWYWKGAQANATKHSTWYFSHSPRASNKSATDMHKAGAGGGVILEKSCQLKSRMDVIDMSDREITLEDDMKTRGLNMEPKRWLSDQQEPMLHGPSSLGHCTQVSPRNDDMHNETCRTLEKANPMVKLVLSLAPNPTNMPKSTSSPGSHSLCPEKNI